MKHLLIVDDDKTNLTMARNALSDTFKVTAVVSGEQALRFLTSNIPDLILLDINMPEMDGFEVMEKIRGQEPLKNIPIVFLTADSESETESRCLGTGAVDFIAKPFVPLVMRSRISRILELEELRRSLANELEVKSREVTEMKNRTSRDPLTGLRDRSYTENAVNASIASGSQGALLMIDMDNFKSVNDVYGHMAGDGTLRMFADILVKNSSEGDILCRLGGDEFIMYISDGSSKDELRATAQSVIDEFRECIGNAGYETDTSVSIGISVSPDDGADFNSLYSAADKALYLVKQNGKNSYHFYSEQKADENKRTGNLVDISFISEYLSRADANNGSYVLNLESFHHVYNFIRRIVERNSSVVQTILFTVSFEPGESSDFEPVLDALEKAVFTSLRRVDVSTRYSGRQVMVVLMDLDRQNCELIAGRITENFRSLYSGPEVSISYEIERLEGKNSR